MDLTQALLAAVGVLAAVIVALWASHMKSVARLDSKLDECEKDRRELWRHMAALENVACSEANCPAKTLAQSVDQSKRPEKTK